MIAKIKVVKVNVKLTNRNMAAPITHLGWLLGIFCARALAHNIIAENGV